MNRAPRSRRALVIAALALGLVAPLAACGGDGGDVAAPAPGTARATAGSGARPDTGRTVTSVGDRVSVGAPAAWKYGKARTDCTPAEKYEKCLDAINPEAKAGENLAVAVVAPPGGKGPQKITGEQWDKMVAGVDKNLRAKGGSARRGPDLTHDGSPVYTWVQTTRVGDAPAVLAVAQLYRTEGNYRVTVSSRRMSEDEALAQVKASVETLEIGEITTSRTAAPGGTATPAATR